MRARLILLMLLLPAVGTAVAQAAEDEVLLAHRLRGALVAVPSVENGEYADRQVVLTFTVPDDAKAVYLQVAEIRREPIEVIAGWDVFLDSPTGASSGATENGNAVGIRGCFLPSFDCSREPEGLRSQALPNAPGPWSVSYSGALYGDYLLEVHIVR